MRKLIISLILIVCFVFLPNATFAQQYGQAPQVLGAQAPEEHKPVETALGDDIKIMASGLILASVTLLFISKRIYANSFKIEFRKGGENISV